MGGSKGALKTYNKPPDSYYGEYKEGKYYVTNPWDEKPIILAKEGPASKEPITIMELVDKVASKNPDNAVMAKEYPDKNGKMIWKQISKKQLLDTSRKTARALIKLGLKEWESVCIMGFNAPEWVYAYLGAMYAGGLACGIYTTNNPGQCEFIVNNAKARIAVLENQKLLKKFLEFRDKCETLEYIILYDDKVPDGVNEEGKAKVMTWEQFMNEDDEKLDNEVDNRYKSKKPGQCCSLIYTSGTTGQPKGVMMSHDNLVYSTQALLATCNYIDFKKPHRIISYLPLSHVAAQFLDIICVLSVNYGIDAKCDGNGCTYFARPDALKGSIKATLQHVKPTIFMGVPRVWEKLADAIKAIGKQSTGIKKALASWSKGVGAQKTENFKIGGSKEVPRGYNIANKVFTKIKTGLGLQDAVLCVTAAAPIKQATVDYFGSLDIQLVQAYGASESAGTHTFAIPWHDKTGTIGVAICGNEIKVDHEPKRDKKNEGELLLRGRNIMMGYIYDEDKSKKTIDNLGYYHSGDVGRCDKDNCYFITGRIKELLITAGGENVAPVPIEGYLKGLLDGVSNIVLIGDQKKYLTMLVTLKCYQDPDTQEFNNDLVGAAKDVDKTCKTVDDARKSSKWTKYIQDAMKKYNADPQACASNAQKVQYFNILDGDFSIPQGELTGTMKLKRPVITQKYNKQIEQMYDKEWTKSQTESAKNNNIAKTPANNDEKKEEEPIKKDEQPKKEEQPKKDDGNKDDKVEEPKKEDKVEEPKKEEELPNYDNEKNKDNDNDNDNDNNDDKPDEVNNDDADAAKNDQDNGDNAD